MTSWILSSRRSSARFANCHLVPNANELWGISSCQTSEYIKGCFANKCASKLNYKKPESLGHQLLYYLPTLTIIAMFIHNYSKYLLFMSNAFITPCNITPKPVKFMSRKDIIALRCAALANLLLYYNLILIKTVIYSMILLSLMRMM